MKNSSNTDESTISKGGSYNHTAAKAAVNNSIDFQNPTPWLGFRMVLEYRDNN
jgi:hypothetical protein